MVNTVWSKKAKYACIYDMALKQKTGWMDHIYSDVFSDEFGDSLNLVTNKSNSTSLRTNPNFVSSSHVCNLATTAFDLTHACLQIPGVVSSTLSLSFSLQPDVHVFYPSKCRVDVLGITLFINFVSMLGSWAMIK